MNKVKQLYDVQSFKRAVEIAKTFKFSTQGMQDSAGILLPRQLEHISTTIHQQKFAELTLLTSAGIFVSNEGGVAEIITKLKEDIEGDFVDAGNTSNTDGVISLSTSADSIKVIMKKASSNWTEIELQQAQLANRNLVGNLLGAHNLRFNQQIDSRGYVGDGALKGLLNWPGFTSAAATGVFSGLTPQQMYDDVKSAVSAQRSAVSNDPVFGGNKVAVSPGVWNLLSETMLNTAAGSDSVMAALKKNLTIDFVITFRATALGVLVVYASDNRAMVMRIPTPLQISNIHQIGFDSHVASLFRVGGLDVIENGSGYILTGVE